MSYTVLQAIYHAINLIMRLGEAMVSLVAATPCNRLPTRTSGYFDPECIQFFSAVAARLMAKSSLYWAVLSFGGVVYFVSGKTNS